MNMLPQLMIPNLVSAFPLMSGLTDNFSSLPFWLASIKPEDTDVIAHFQEAFKHFVETGQVWALVIGVILGYLFRTFTAY